MSRNIPHIFGDLKKVDLNCRPRFGRFMVSICPRCMLKIGPIRSFETQQRRYFRLSPTIGRSSSRYNRSIRKRQPDIKEFESFQAALEDATEHLLEGKNFRGMDRKRLIYNEINPSCNVATSIGFREELKRKKAGDTGVVNIPELKRAYEEGKVLGLRVGLEMQFKKYVALQGITLQELALRKQILDCTHLKHLFPRARGLRRTIHLHVGPTNSGKTHGALNRLANVNVGWYAGPLRLLAYEVFIRLNARGVPTNMVTGEDYIRPHEHPQVTSTTVEMLPYHISLDCLVIDEIQMIADPGRGWAWTNALVGAVAKEVHCCGEESIVDLVQAIAKTLNEEVVIHRYERLSPLEIEDKSLRGDLTKVQKGDCVVTFSRNSIYETKRFIELNTPFRCAAVYGKLPPDVRVRQQDLFNSDDSGYDVLVASDAVGMGLNLSIRRVIFTTFSKKHKGISYSVSPSLVKQIAGRAGRFGANTGDTMGHVTTLYDEDLEYLKQSFGAPITQHKQACFKLPEQTLYKFRWTFPPTTTFPQILLQAHAITILPPLYKMMDCQELLESAVHLKGFPQLLANNQVHLLELPLRGTDPISYGALIYYLRCISKNVTCKANLVVDFQRIEELKTVHYEQLQLCEHYYRILDSYLWLA